MNQFLLNRLKSHGITLVEVLVVVVIISILAVIAVPSFIEQMQQQRVLANTAERSMQQLHSMLNRSGRRLARQLQQASQLPVYYALYSGSSKDCRNENNKLCPGCGGKWRLSAPLHELFDFKCDKCRLLSNIAWDCQSPADEQGES